MRHSAKTVLAVAILLSSVFQSAFGVRMRTTLHTDDDPLSNFSKILEYAGKVKLFARIPVFKAACGSIAFTCEEIIQLASFATVGDAQIVWGPEMWEATVMVFAEGRSNKGCIADPANAKLLVDAFEQTWQRQWETDTEDTDEMIEIKEELTQVFITNNRFLKPANFVGARPEQLHTGLRSDTDMDTLLADIKQLMPEPFVLQSGSLFEKKFQYWLLDIRSAGEQFSGPQLVALVKAIPVGFGLAQTVSVMLKYLEQYVTGVTCEEVNTIQRRMALLLTDSEHRIAGLTVLKSSIIDLQNKVAIVADNFVQAIGLNQARLTEEALRDVVVGLPPRNNPVFGVVKGNPVVLVIDESDSMSVSFTLGNDTIVRRKFCHSQLETALEGLPEGTHFNVIQYDSSPVSIFREPVLASRTNIDAAMNKVSSTWRDNYAWEQDPVKWLRMVHGFSLKFRHQFAGSTPDFIGALQLAYATAGLPSEQTVVTSVKMAEMDEAVQGTQLDHRARAATKDLPQIYFLTSRCPVWGAGHILDKIDEFDNGRDIPVNSITFSNSVADPMIKQFGKDLASKTGGFFRSIEQA